MVVAEHASFRFGGEAALPLHWFRMLRRRGIDAWLVVHARTQDELVALMPDEQGRIHYVPDTRWHRLLWHAESWLPDRIAAVTCSVLSGLHTQTLARRIVRRLVVRHGIDVVHEPIRVSPKHPSRMYDLGAPVVMGPLNGGMTFPPGFRNRQGTLERWFLSTARWLSEAAHWWIPGKRRAATLLVANERTRRALPSGISGWTVEMIENGVDGSLWFPRERPARNELHFLFVGRLVDWKGVDLLLRAFARPARDASCRLDILGDGPERSRLEALARELGLGTSARFLGFLPQEEAAERLRAADALVLPSLFECGGAVVLEALACGVCAIATRWGGPADYLDDTCGILVDPDEPDRFVAALEAAILRLARDPAACKRLGSAGPHRIAALGVEWEAKVDRILEIYREAITRASRPA